MADKQTKLSSSSLVIRETQIKIMRDSLTPAGWLESKSQIIKKIIQVDLKERGLYALLRMRMGMLNDAPAVENGLVFP